MYTIGFRADPLTPRSKRNPREAEDVVRSGGLLSVSGRRAVVVEMVVVVVVVEVVDWRVLVARRRRHTTAADVPIREIAGQEGGASPVVGRSRRRRVLRDADRFR